MRFEFKSGAEVREMVRGHIQGSPESNDQFVIAYDEANGDLLGFVGVKRLNWVFSEIRHLFVSPLYRGLGTSHNLIREAVRRVETPFVISTVHATNPASIATFLATGFTADSRFRSPRTGNGLILFSKKVQED